MKLNEINDFCVDVLKKAGASQKQAEAAALSVMDAEAEGIRNVGLGYLPHYLHHLKVGKVRGDAEPKLIKKSASTLLVDTQYGFAHTAYIDFEQELIEMAKKEGSATLALRHSYSGGVLGWFNRRLAKHNLISLMFSNSSKAVAAHGGKVPFFGTNPFSFGAPTHDDDSIIVDMATAATARVNIADAAREGRPIDEGLAIDSDGKPTTDAAAALAGAQLPLAGPKGFGLGLMVDIMAGALTGSNCSYEMSMFGNSEGGPPDVGQVIIAFNPDFYSESYTEHLTTMLSAMMDNNDVRLPGGRRHQLRREHEKNGIDVPDDLTEAINSIVA